MSVIIPKTVAFGNSKTGLATVGLALLNPDGTVHTARTTTGVYEMAGGGYGKNVTFPDDWKGILKWDTGEGSPLYAFEDYNYLKDAITMRGTDSAALASVCTEGRLSELDAANIPADVDSILADTGTDGVVVASGSKTGYALSDAGVDAILDEVVEGTLTFRQTLRLFISVLAGKSAGGGTVTLTFRDVADGKNRITATVDANGNRTAISLDGT